MAKAPDAFVYNATLERIVDGDTFDCSLDISPPLALSLLADDLVNCCHRLVILSFMCVHQALTQMLTP